MKKMMRNGNPLRRGVSLLLMLSLLITLLPTSSFAATTVGAYGSVTVTTKNVVIRSTPAGSRTGFFAQIGTYPMIGPVVDIDGVKWYNLQTNETSGYVSGEYATANFGSAGMPATQKVYAEILGDTTITEGANPLIPGAGTPVVPKGTILQLADGNKPYNATIGGSSVDYINVYYNNIIYHVPYNNISKGIMTQDNLNSYITGTRWKAITAETRTDAAKGDFLTHAIQAALYILGYYTSDVDGFYGANTTSAVLKFQEDMIKTGGSYASWTANGQAVPATINALFDQALDRIAYLRSTDGLGSSTGGATTTVSMIQTTVKNLRIRKSYSTSSAYVGVIPTAGTILNYTRTYVNGSTTWYYVQYNGTYGWVIGTYASPYTPPTTSTGTTTTTTITNWGSVTITKKLVAIRKTPNGARTGYHVNTGDVCTLLGVGVKAGDYTWYPIRTENGREGYVRSDCVKVTLGSAGMPSTKYSYVNILYDTIMLTPGISPASPTPGGVSVTNLKGKVLQLETGISYTYSDVAYINVYYNNVICFTRYNSEFTNGLMSTDNVNNYVVNTVWAQGLATGEKAANDPSDLTVIRTGDIRVYAIQAALYQLKYLTDKSDFDGIYGTATENAVKAYKTASGYTVNTTINSDDSVKLFTAAKAALNAKLAAASAQDTSNGTVLTAGDFGTFTTVKKGSWSEIDGGATSLFPKGSVAYVMSVNTKQVFRLYRWSGANHADCVPYDTTDTATLCSIVGTAYNSASPTSSELALIKGAGNDDWPSYTWPKMRWANVNYFTSYKIPVWVNLNGTVYCASIYVIPHGFTGTSSFSKQELSGQFYYQRNNMYGMLCVHFYGSTTHSSGKVDAEHAANITAAYNAAKTYSLFSGKVK